VTTPETEAEFEDDSKARTPGQRVRRYLVAGLLVWLPIVVTIFVLKFLVGLVDQTMLLVPARWRPEEVLGFGIPGLGLVLALIVLLSTGLAVTNLVGRRLVSWWEDLMKRIPVVRSIYSGAKTFTETVFTPKGQAFKRVLLVQYPREGIWTMGFQSGDEVGEAAHLAGRRLVCVFIPTTPNPTSGFIIMVPREDVRPLNMTVDDAMRWIFTLGVASPTWNGNEEGQAAGSAQVPTQVPPQALRQGPEEQLVLEPPAGEADDGPSRREP
jgi:uncharacterized membrane protein